MKIYRHGDTYIAPRGSFFDGNVKIDGNFIAPPDTHIWGNIVVAGCLELGPYSTVGGYVEAKRVIIGHDVRVRGPLNVLETPSSATTQIFIPSMQEEYNPPAGVRVGDVNSKETSSLRQGLEDRLFGRAVKVTDMKALDAEHGGILH